MNRRTVFIVSAFVVGFVAGSMLWKPGKTAEPPTDFPRSFVVDYPHPVPNSSPISVRLTVVRVIEGGETVYDRQSVPATSAPPLWRFDAGGGRVYLASAD